MDNHVGRQFSIYQFQKQGTLKRKFNLESRINRDRNNWRLRFSKCEFQKLKELIEPFIIPSMRYKIVPVETESIKTR